MIYYVVRHIDEFEEVFSSEKIKPTTVHKHFKEYKTSRFDYAEDYLTLLNILPELQQNEFAIEMNINSKRNILELNEKVSLYSRCISLNWNSIESVLFSKKQIADIFKNRIKITKTIKSIDELSKRIKSSDSILKLSTVSYSNVNPLIQSEVMLTSIENCLKGAIYYCAIGNKEKFTNNSRVSESIKITDKLRKLQDQMADKNKYFKAVNRVINSEIHECGLDTVNFINRRKSLIGYEKNKIVVRSIHDNYSDDLLFKTILKHLLFNNKSKLKETLISIGEEIGQISDLEKYLDEYRLIYDIVINSNLKRNPNDICNKTLKALLVAALNYQDLQDVYELSNNYEIDDSVDVYIFSGALLGFSHMSSHYKAIVDSDELTKKMVSKEVNQVKSYISNYYEACAYAQIEKFRKSNFVYNLRKKQVNNELFGLKINDVNHEITRVRIDDDYCSYRVNLNRNQTRSFFSRVERLRLNSVYSSKSLYNSITLIKTSSDSLMNDIDFMKISRIAKNVN